MNETEKAEVGKAKLAADEAQGRKVPLWLLEALLTKYKGHLEVTCPDQDRAIEELILIVEAVTVLRRGEALDQFTAVCLGQEIVNLCWNMAHME
ncbi:MAG: hypothetical protein HPY85_06915 [Anaerolineae bacterium]|nr:hypothetical protein [Anaerolineae bacterium]